MATPYIGEIRMFGGNFAINGWAFCNGAIMPISENETLFNLIGTTFGGDGQSTYALPDLQGRVPMHFGNGGGGSYVLGQKAGTESVTLITQQMPAHTHLFEVGVGGSGVTTSDDPNGKALASGIQQAFSPTLIPTTSGITNTLTGGNQPHDNMAPYLAVTFLISLYGVFPSPN
jgi:microcystin-dependent protein